MDRMREPFGRSRRRTLKLLGAVGVAAGALSVGTLLPVEVAFAETLGMPQPDEKVADTMKRLFGGRPVQDAGGRLKLDAPLIAENGAVVPISVEINAPMTPQSYVKSIYIISDKNRRPLNARFSLTPAMGQASIGTNLRLGETTDVRAVAEMNDGTLLMTKREVKVTVGGCGG
jgi:sulfur-oxidizing protein SoxY